MLLILHYLEELPIKPNSVGQKGLKMSDIQLYLFHLSDDLFSKSPKILYPLMTGSWMP